MLHAAVAGRFFVAGPAIMVSASFEDVRARIAEYVEKSGEDSGGVPAWKLRNCVVQDYDHIHPLLVHDHEYEHFQLLTSTPTGTLLTKLHQVQAGRLEYMMAKLHHKLGGTFPIEPPFGT
jgi:hypothetical protein